MDRRSETISSRVTKELLAQVQAVCIARDTTVSDLTFMALTDLVERERQTYLRLSAVFGADQGLQNGDGT
jgi:hypothetical protein